MRNDGRDGHGPEACSPGPAAGRQGEPDWVGLNLEAGFSIGSAEQATVSGLGLGVGVNLYGDSPDPALRPYLVALREESECG